MEVNLETEVSGIVFKNPIIAGSAGYAADENGLRRIIKRGYAGVVTKSTSKGPLMGAPAPRVFWYNPYEKTWIDGAEAHRNPGIESMTKAIRECRDLAEKQNCHIIGSIAVSSVEESVEVAQKFEDAGVSAIELDMICPNVGAHLEERYESGGEYWGNPRYPERAIKLIKAMKNAVDVPIWPKLNPVAIYLVGERITKEADPNAYTWIGSFFPNTPVGLAIDLESGRPIISANNLLKVQQGKKFIPLAHLFPFWPATVLSTAMIKNKIRNVPVAPSGGIRRGFEVLQVMMAGANAVEICTAVYKNLDIIDQILMEIKWFMQRKGYDKIREIIGASLDYIPFEFIEIPLPSI
jgi:dihydroorotate dehydrogenase